MQSYIPHEEGDDVAGPSVAGDDSAEDEFRGDLHPPAPPQHPDDAYASDEHESSDKQSVTDPVYLSESGDSDSEGRVDVPEPEGTPVPSSDEAEPEATDYLAGRNLATSNRSHVAQCNNMSEFEREMVRLQTENEMSKSACQRLFEVLQGNSNMLAEKLPDWKGSFKSARRRVLALIPAVSITVVGTDDGMPVELGPYSAYPKKLVEDRDIQVRYTLFTCKLVDVIALHAHIHGTEGDISKVWSIDIGLDGVPESVSGGVSIDVLTVRFAGCRSVYSLAVLRPRRTGLNICDSVTIKKALDEYEALQEGTVKGVNRVALRFVICDAPKRARLLAQKSHSGYSSCQHCHVKGKYVDGAVCFPPEPEHGLSEPRTKATFEECADQAARDGASDCRGIKGSSLLRRITGFDYVANVVHDRMHLCDLGACRQLVRHMFGGRIGAPTKRSAQQMFRPVSAAGYDAGARLVKVPSEFSRRTRDLNYGSWKAEEYRCGLLYRDSFYSYMTVISNFYLKEPLPGLLAFNR